MLNNIIILAISFFSLNAFSQSEVTPSKVNDFLTSNSNIRISCAPSKINDNDKVKIAVQFINSRVLVLNTHLNETHIAFSNSLSDADFKNGKSLLIKELNSRCSSASTASTAFVGPTQTVQFSDYNKTPPDKAGDNSTANSNTETCKDAKGNKIKCNDTTSKPVGTGTATAGAPTPPVVKPTPPPPPAPPKVTTEDRDSNGYTKTTIDHKNNGDKTVIVNDKDGNSIVSNTTVKDGKENTVSTAYDKDGKPIDISSLPQEMQDKVKGPMAQATGDKKDHYPDTPAGRKAKQEAEDKVTKTRNEHKQLQSINAEIKKEVDQCHLNTSCSAALALLNQVETQAAEAEKEQNSCDGSSSKANFLCPIATNPQIQVVSLLMNGLSATLPSILGAKDTCAATSKTNLIGQSVIGVGTLVCSISKGQCEKKCASTNVVYDTVKKTYNDINAALLKARSESELQIVTPPTAQSAIHEQNLVVLNAALVKMPYIAQVIDPQYELNIRLGIKCDGYKLDMAQMATTGLNMMAAASQAQRCVQQLSGQEGATGKSATLTMDQLCSKPAEASSTICKCRYDNTIQGCPGYVAGSKNEGNLNKNINSKGVAGMAGLSFGKKITPAGGTPNTDLGDLSDEAKKALAAGADPSDKSGPLNGIASAGSPGGGGGGGSSAAGVAGSDKKGNKLEDSKSIGSSFMNAVGSLFGKGGGSTKAAAGKVDPLQSDKYKEKIKRQIAAEQMRSEISSASGMDNWSKIRSRYKSTSGSLIDNN